MPTFTAEELRMVMNLKHNIRNISVIGHIGHGKSTLTDSLVAAASIIPQKVAGAGLSIKSTVCYERNGNKYLFDLIDSPGHADFSPEVTTALRITDGALVIVDCIEGVCLQTKSVLHQVMREKVRPVLILNKIDRCFLDLGLDGEQTYQALHEVIGNVNFIMDAYKDPLFPDFMVYPEKGMVAFSSALQGWAFNLNYFAKMYAKYEVDEEKMLERLWGENYFEQKTKTWTEKSTSSPTCIRGFIQFCYEPIKLIVDDCMNNRKDELWLKLSKFGVIMKSEEKKLCGETLLKRVMQKWLPAVDVLREMIIFHLPSPQTAQRYRVDFLYKGPLDDRYANAIRNCDPDGPLMIYVSKMIHGSDKGKFLAVGRVFAGRVSTGSQVRIMGRDYVPGENNDLYVKTVIQTSIWVGGKLQIVQDVPCGNTVVLHGLDGIIKSATLTNKDENEAHSIRSMIFVAVPVIGVTVQTKDISDLQNIVEGLNSLYKSDPIVVYRIEESGEHAIVCVGELHLRTCLKYLKDKFMGGAEIDVSDKFVPLRETVSNESSCTILSKSPNEHNPNYMKATSMFIAAADAIDLGRIDVRDDSEVYGKILSKALGWDEDLTKDIWCFGPKGTGPNMVVNRCKGVDQYLNEIKDSVVAGFQSASEAGALARERMRGICFEVCDAPLLAYAIHCGGEDQVIRTAEHVIYASQLTAKPRLMEPIYSVEIQAPGQELVKIKSLLKQRRGRLFREKERPMTQLYNIEARLPVLESFGFSDALGDLPLQCTFTCWKMMESDPLEAGSLANKLVCQIRDRKGLKKL